MQEYLVTIGRPPAQISFKIHDETTLEEQLSTSKKYLEILISALPMLKDTVTRKPKPGMENIYQFTSDRRLELVRFPEKGVHTVFLALYCYDPDPVSVDQLIESTGLARSSVSGFLSQKPYDQYVYKLGKGLYRLNFKGKKLVISTVLPGLEIEVPFLEGDSTDVE